MQPRSKPAEQNSSENDGSRSPLIFFVLVYALAIPFWLIGAATGTELLPGLPMAALMTVCPAAAALLLVYRTNKIAGVTALLKRSFDYPRISSPIWYLPVLLLIPLVAALSFTAIRWLGTPIPVPPFSILTSISLFIVFFVAAVGEELGWSGYAIDPLQRRLGALPASLLVGSVWALMHFIPLLEAHRSCGSAGGLSGLWRCG